MHRVNLGVFLFLVCVCMSQGSPTPNSSTEKAKKLIAEIQKRVKTINRETLTVKEKETEQKKLKSLVLSELEVKKKDDMEMYKNRAKIAEEALKTQVKIVNSLKLKGDALRLHPQVIKLNALSAHAAKTKTDRNNYHKVVDEIFKDLGNMFNENLLKEDKIIEKVKKVMEDQKKQLSTLQDEAKKMGIKIGTNGKLEIPALFFHFNEQKAMTVLNWFAYCAGDPRYVTKYLPNWSHFYRDVNDGKLLLLCAVRVTSDRLMVVKPGSTVLEKVQNIGAFLKYAGFLGVRAMFKPQDLVDGSDMVSVVNTMDEFATKAQGRRSINKLIPPYGSAQSSGSGWPGAQTANGWPGSSGRSGWPGAGTANGWPGSKTSGWPNNSLFKPALGR